MRRACVCPHSLTLRPSLLSHRPLIALPTSLSPIAHRASYLVLHSPNPQPPELPGYATTYKILKQGDGKAIAKGNTATVHATGVVKETGKQFWSTKDAGQQPFTYQAGVGG